MSGNLYNLFKERIPTNEEICDKAANEILKDLSLTDVKSDFSRLVNDMHDEVYRQYLIYEEKIGNDVLKKNVISLKKIFVELNSFFMSISQSRKSRAGKAFEYIIRTLFKRLGYHFSEQVNIDGAKPDFVLPSEKYFKERPLDCVIFTAKRTLRERWRQVVTEANKGYGFFLATMDEKVSLNQIQNMAMNKVYLVVPKNIKNENETYRDQYNVISFEDFFKNHLDPSVKRWGNIK
jgi:hypothetical protein